MTPTLGQIAYDAYCEARNWKSIRGEPLPHFRQQAPDIIAAWEKAADAVAIAIRNQTSQG